MKRISWYEVMDFDLWELVDYQLYVYGSKPSIHENNSFNNHLLCHNLEIDEELLDRIIDLKRKNLKSYLLNKIGG